MSSIFLLFPSIHYYTPIFCLLSLLLLFLLFFFFTLLSFSYSFCFLCINGSCFLSLTFMTFLSSFFYFLTSFIVSTYSPSVSLSFFPFPSLSYLSSNHLDTRSRPLYPSFKFVQATMIRYPLSKKYLVSVE